MATNYSGSGRYQECAVASTVRSGDPVVLGTLPGVAIGDYGSGTSYGTAVVDFGPAIYELPVKAHDGSVDAAVAQFDRVYYDATLGGLNKNSGGVPYGYALDAVASGATAKIRVYIR